MFPDIWPFYTSLPKEENIPIFSSLPAWATVGLDMTPEEFGSILSSRASEGKNVILFAVDAIYPYLSVVLLAAVVISLCKVYMKKLKRRSELKSEIMNTATSLADWKTKGLALKEAIISGLEDVERRLLTLQQKLQVIQEKRRRTRGKIVLRRQNRRMYSDSLPSCCSSFESLSQDKNDKKNLL
ncbi:hypothetical protein AALO_G00251050 [Alosa alosa]|uniref:Uncharacterized protein n=1 Tax=Alosa alosa TaxID=278164 RepID=A0AAV6FUS6_9TELE|nr:hypothetical protein AALO_G00251050 [Alosa alosa]